MKQFSNISIDPDFLGFIDTISRKSLPKRVHFFELFMDEEVQELIFQRYDLESEIDEKGAYRRLQKQVVLQKFLGYDYVACGLDDFFLPIMQNSIQDTAAIHHSDGRKYMEEHSGPIGSIEEFERFPWPDPDRLTTKNLEWYEKNLPENMCIVTLTGQFCEYLTWLMGYETLCYALFDNRKLVKLICERLLDLYGKVIARVLHFSRVRIIMGSDDMGYKTGPLISPDDLREFVLPGHKMLADMAKSAGRLYMLHSCGDLSSIMNDLIDYVGIDAKHSFEDVIMPVGEAKAKYGRRIALIGGVDVDFLCRADEEEVREKTRETLRECMPGGGYCLGTGNSVANYIPLSNYLAMLDEGRKYPC